MNQNQSLNNFVKAIISLAIILLVVVCTGTVTPTLAPTPTSISFLTNTIEPSLTNTSTLTSTVQPTLTQTLSPTVNFSARNVTRFDNLGILWIECELPIPQGHTEEECLGVTKTSWDDVEIHPFSVSYVQENGLGDGRRLIIDNDVYEAVSEVFPIDGHLSYSNQKGDYVFNLYKNGEIIITKTSREIFYDPNFFLININGKYAWELALHEKPTIIYNGIDMAQYHGLDGVYRASIINDKLIYIAKKNKKAFIGIEGKQVGPLFDSLSIGGFCCEPSRTVERRPGQYWYWGSRAGKSYAGVIKEIEP